MMIELNATSLTERLTQHADPSAVFFYTPLCGTCKLAQRMLVIAIEALPASMEALPGNIIYTCNVNFMPERVIEWEIESVPCLVITEHGKPIRKIYAFQSVDSVYKILKGMATSEGQ